MDGVLIKDRVLDVFETGEKEVFEIELENGIVLRSTLDHKFLCTDGAIRTVSDILEADFEIQYEFLHESNIRSDSHEKCSQ